ncbi:MAG: hydrogenase expression/formation protein HypE [Candidatus Brocadiaceae bacterium]|nr:hydrogenase expression/formation protein HypE [Candidatus Brocadiaceae bacterium]
MSDDHIRLGHGSGGILTRRLIEGTLLNHFRSPVLQALPDSAWLEVGGACLAFTTDSFVVDPIVFPGGDIGSLAVFGTVNDLAVAGAAPRYISCALILEAGLPTAELDAVLASMARAAEEAGVEVVTGDTKVVPRGKADRIFINTAGIGTPMDGCTPPGGPAHEGDVVIVSGPVGDHGAAVLSRREGMAMETTILSDCAPLTRAAAAVLRTARRVPFLRDLTRGGLATVLNEATGPGRPGLLIHEERTPVHEQVRAICEVLGLDPLYMACEGRLGAVVDAESVPAVLAALRAVPGAEGAAAVGEVTARYEGTVALQTALGTRRLLQMLSGEQLPRIC